jgi:hypothetical protein
VACLVRFGLICFIPFCVGFSTVGAPTCRSTDGEEPKWTWWAQFVRQETRCLMLLHTRVVVVLVELRR